MFRIMSGMKARFLVALMVVLLVLTPNYPLILVVEGHKPRSTSSSVPSSTSSNNSSSPSFTSYWPSTSTSPVPPSSMTPPSSSPFLAMLPSSGPRGSVSKSYKSPREPRTTSNDFVPSDISSDVPSQRPRPSPSPSGSSQSPYPSSSSSSSSVSLMVPCVPSKKTNGRTISCPDDDDDNDIDTDVPPASVSARTISCATKNGEWSSNDKKKNGCEAKKMKTTAFFIPNGRKLRGGTLVSS
jgi:hypothetical protein